MLTSCFTFTYLLTPCLFSLPQKHLLFPHLLVPKSNSAIYKMSHPRNINYLLMGTIINSYSSQFQRTGIITHLALSFSCLSWSCLFMSSAAFLSSSSRMRFSCSSMSALFLLSSMYRSIIFLDSACNAVLSSGNPDKILP